MMIIPTEPLTFTHNILENSVYINNINRFGLKAMLYHALLVCETMCQSWCYACSHTCAQKQNAIPLPGPEDVNVCMRSVK